MNNIENQIICSLQYQLDALKKDNLNYISTISDLENNINNLQNKITQQNKEIERLKEQQNTHDIIDSPNTSIFRKILNFKF
jgi:hypothetical protein